MHKKWANDPPAAFFANSRMERIEGTQVTTIFVSRPWIAALATAMAVLAIDGEAQGSETCDQLHYRI